MYKVIFDDVAIDFLKKLDKTISKRIWSKITFTKTDPFRYFIRLSGREDYKLRVGDYRVIADIDAGKIRITLIGHRKNVYD